eukprot:Em0022g96a
MSASASARRLPKAARAGGQRRRTAASDAKQKKGAQRPGREPQRPPHPAPRPKRRPAAPIPAQRPTPSSPARLTQRHGQIPAILYPRHTKLGSPDEFCAPFYEAVRLLTEYASNSPQWVNHESTRRAFSIFEQATGEGQDVGAQLIRSGEVFVCRGESDRPHLLHSPTNAMCGVHWNQCTTPGSSQEGCVEAWWKGDRICERMHTSCGNSDRKKLSSSYVAYRQTPLLRGRQSSFATASVSPPYESLRDIVRCAGGELLDEQEMRNRFGRTLEHIDQNLPLVVISCHEDVESGHCAEFFARTLLSTTLSSF